MVDLAEGLPGVVWGTLLPPPPRSPQGELGRGRGGPSTAALADLKPGCPAEQPLTALLELLQVLKNVF